MQPFSGLTLFLTAIFLVSIGTFWAGEITSDNDAAITESEYRILAQNYGQALAQIKTCPDFDRLEFLQWINRSMREE